MQHRSGLTEIMVYFSLSYNSRAVKVFSSPKVIRTSVLGISTLLSLPWVFPCLHGLVWMVPQLGGRQKERATPSFQRHHLGLQPLARICHMALPNSKEVWETLRWSKIKGG